MDTEYAAGPRLGWGFNESDLQTPPGRLQDTWRRFMWQSGWEHEHQGYSCNHGPLSEGLSFLGVPNFQVNAKWYKEVLESLALAGYRLSTWSATEEPESELLEVYVVPSRGDGDPLKAYEWRIEHGVVTFREAPPMTPFAGHAVVLVWYRPWEWKDSARRPPDGRYSGGPPVPAERFIRRAWNEVLYAADGTRVLR